MTVAARLNDRQFRGHRVRRIPHPLDDVIIAVIASYRTASPSERQAMADELNGVALGALCTFPERSAAVAVRTQSVEPLRQGLAGLGMVAGRLSDPHAHLYPLAAVNHAADLLGTDLATIIGAMARELSEAASTQFRLFVSRNDRDKSLKAFGLQTQGEGDTFRYW
ncbi:hypothetical protein [Dactylosporangium sp. CS-033363]|uniref:hypothetical protein n=1 Tax=Dactylosporangium sp. CS-033363 TaxID=3239935 RepID=UPI003D8AACCB